MKVFRICTKRWLQARGIRLCAAFEHTLDSGELGRRRNLESGLCAQDIALMNRRRK
jgi:hypothetical protein